jgi:hypothetical protein
VVTPATGEAPSIIHPCDAHKASQSIAWGRISLSLSLSSSCVILLSYVYVSPVWFGIGATSHLTSYLHLPLHSLRCEHIGATSHLTSYLHLPLHSLRCEHIAYRACRGFRVLSIPGRRCEVCGVLVSGPATRGAAAMLARAVEDTAARRTGGAMARKAAYVTGGDGPAHTCPPPSARTY